MLHQLGALAPRWLHAVSVSSPRILGGATSSNICTSEKSCTKQLRYALNHTLKGSTTSRSGQVGCNITYLKEGEEVSVRVADVIHATHFPD